MCFFSGGALILHFNIKKDMFVWLAVFRRQLSLCGLNAGRDRSIFSSVSRGAGVIQSERKKTTKKQFLKCIFSASVKQIHKSLGECPENRKTGYGTECRGSTFRGLFEESHKQIS